VAARAFRVLTDAGGFFECPRWHDGRWWVSDFYHTQVLSIGDPGDVERVVEVEGQPSGLGWMPDGSLLIGSMRDHRILRLHPDGRLAEHADLSEHCGGWLNDLVVDRQGRAFVGDFGFDLMAMADPRPTGLVRVDPDGSLTRVADDLWFPNGCVLSDDGALLIVGETAASRYSAFSVLADGSLAERRTWAQLGPTPDKGSFAEMLGKLEVAPDGCCLDAEGCLWVADALGRRALRVAPGGEVREELASPDGLGFFACMLGGEDGRTLLLCAAPDFFEQNRTAKDEAVLLTTTVEVPHAGLP